MILRPARYNMVNRSAEAWRPPPFTPNQSLRSSLAARARRFLDLQASTIWNDLKHVLSQAQGTVLDVGCGAQPYRSLLPSTVKYRGIDRAEVGGHFGYQLPDVEYYSGDNWPVANEECDVVLATETLEHVPDPAQFLSEAKRVLKSGGTLVLTVPFAARWHYIPDDYWRFTPSGLSKLLVEAGFTEVGVYARGNAITVACYKVMAVLLPLLASPATNRLSWICRRFLGVLSLPCLVLLAAIAHATLGEGDDCLGYTIIANRP